MMRRTITTTARNGYRNLVGTVTVSLLVSLSLLPLAGMVVVGTPVAVLAGLWATCLVFGVVMIGGFRFSMVVADRGVPVPVVSHLRAAIRSPRQGLTLGVLTFTVVVAAGAIVVLVPTGLASFGFGVTAFLLVDWYLVVAFAVPEIGAGQSLRTAFRASVVRLVEHPAAVATFLVISLVCTFVAGATVVTVALLLPGVLCLLAAQVTHQIDEARSVE